MALFPFANWKGPVPNRTVNGMVRPLRGLILHIQEGTEAGTNDWFHDKSSQASSHFGNPKHGQIDQWVDTKDKAWAEVSGNPYWISLENEGKSGESLTSNQIENAAQLLAWLHTTEGIPLQITDSLEIHGLGWHGMGGEAWGDHLDCPGEPIKAQRHQIITRAQQLVGDNSTAHPTLRLGDSGDEVKHLQTLLGGLPVDGEFGAETQAAVKNFQSRNDLTADGIVGPDTWAILLS